MWEDSWGYLYERYARAMRLYVLDLTQRRHGRPATLEGADDLVHDYLAVCMEEGWLSGKAGEVRTFRAYLQTQLARFVSKHFRRGEALKRGGGKVLQADDFDRIPDPSPHDPADRFQNDWFRVLIGRARRAMGRQHPSEAWIIDDLLCELNEGRTSPGLGLLLGLEPSPLARKKYVARHRFALLISLELRQTVRDEDTFVDEYALLVRYAPWLEELS